MKLPGWLRRLRGPGDRPASNAAVGSQSDSREATEFNTRPATSYSADQPIRSKEEDRFNRWPFAVQIRPPQPWNDEGLAHAAAANPFRLSRLQERSAPDHGPPPLVDHAFFGDQRYALAQAPPISIARSLSLRRSVWRKAST